MTDIFQVNSISLCDKQRAPRILFSMHTNICKYKSINKSNKIWRIMRQSWNEQKKIPNKTNGKDKFKEKFCFKFVFRFHCCHTQWFLVGVRAAKCVKEIYLIWLSLLSEFYPCRRKCCLSVCEFASFSSQFSFAIVARAHHSCLRSLYKHLLSNFQTIA